MRVRVRSPAGDIFVDADPSATVAKFKENVAQAADVDDWRRLKLIFMARVMQDDKLLSDFNITEDHTVHLVVRAPEAPAAAQPEAAPQPQAQQSQQSQQRQAPQPDANPFAAFGGGGGDPVGGVDIGGLLSGVLGQAMGMAQQLGANAARGNAAPGAEPQPAPQPRQAPEATTTAAPPPRAEPQPEAAPRANPAPQAQGPSAEATATTTTTTTVQQPPVAGFHVHVHVTMDELEQLPARLQRFAATQPAPAVNVSVHRHQTNAAGGIREAMSGVMHNVSPMVQSAVNAARSAATAAGAAANAPPAAPAAPAGPSASQPRRTVAQMAREAGVADEEPQSIFDALASSLTGALDMGDMMQLFQGNWAPAQKARKPLYDFIMKSTDGDTSDVERTRLAQETAHMAVQQLVEEPMVMRQIQTRQRENRNVPRALEALLRRMSRALIDLTLDDSNDTGSFSRGLRPLIVRHVGMGIDYSDRVLFNNGRADTDAVLRLAIDIVMRKAVQQFPDFAPMQMMGANMFMNFARSWQNEYTATRSSTEADDYIFDEEAKSLPPRPARQAPSATARSESDAILDEALDAALDEGSAPAAAAGNGLAEALQRAGLDDAGSAAVLDAVRNAPSASSATAPGDAYTTVYKGEE